MRFGIISDSHDNIWHLEKVLRRLVKEKVWAIIHCRNFYAPFVLLQLAETKLPIHLVWGNTNDKKSERNICESTDNLMLHENIGRLTLGRKKIAFTHYPEEAMKLARTGKYDLVFQGYNHIHSDEMIGKTRLINPWDVMGNKLPATFVIYDTDNDKLSLFDIAEI